MLLFLNCFLSFSQETVLEQKPAFVKFQWGRIVTGEGQKMSPEQLQLLFEDPADFQAYRRSVAWKYVCNVMALSSFGGAIAFGTSNNAAGILGCFGVFAGSVLADSLLKNKMVRYVNQYNSLGIVPARVQVSIAPTPGGIGLCLQF